MVRRIVLATGNRGKAREFAALLGSDWEICLQSELGVKPVAETGDSFAANALIKARHAAAATGLPALADDSGLEVDALDGAPGVLSARYAGEAAGDADNLRLLLARMAAVPAGRRTARFRCVLAYVRGAEDPAPLLVEGSWEGRIATSARGAAGFGYDPVFEDGASGLTAAELPAERKNALSHRGRALRALREQLRERGEGRPAPA
ncbi:MAG: non-canonical purine NTP pyrophosphatase [Gammaproteobacteria bacterium]|nr:MAG: RdgB/HAM1 family non-canonical purine NTP pyrophosphatase [Pseudomonadota bacterium]MBC6945469.1 RdgB/HAM1 family non-canonical purine NTP pyrophosphatase [Gammaproteobacteria bacterium]MCE7896925.1 RdgB/HAM1 family non-canonical purine NTP pyrophosphatase [Gammaproteobacteria bacterium PRO8]MCQ3934548.1 non-canonical purine NTP pyrophosphatase, RdgB/HAM1 family [Gammaproteobacteria bacterium]MDL1881156.1 RdgB/HAM1 family non-canonical purine NTP pyrophosphatase [Gammaproteobacteria bac